MKNISVYIDIVFCVIVLPVMILIFPVERWFYNFTGFMVSLVCWLYLLYFMNRAVMVPSLFAGGWRRWGGAGLILISFVVTFLFSHFPLYTPKPNIHNFGVPRVLPQVQQYQQCVWTLFMIVEAFSFAVGLLTQIDRQKNRRRLVEQERDRAEIELYKAQIKPHFMFNTLNSIYGLFLTRDEHGLEALERFISMMRYVHTTSSRDTVPVCEEADYIRQYIGLQSLRLNGMTEVSLHIDIADPELMVPPMLLVTFVENCFKHGVSPVERSVISISLTEAGGRLRFSTVNRIFPVNRKTEHMGIGNCQKRLAHLFPGRHMLDISREGDLFKVKLEIDIFE